MANEIFKQWAGNIVSGNGPFSQIVNARQGYKQRLLQNQMAREEFDRKLQMLSLKTRHLNEVEVPNVQLRDEAAQLDQAKFGRQPEDAASRAIMSHLDPAAASEFAGRRAATSAPFVPKNRFGPQAGEDPNVRTTRYTQSPDMASAALFGSIPQLQAESAKRELGQVAGKASTRQNIQTSGYKDRRDYAIENQPATAYERNFDLMDNRSLLNNYRKAVENIAKAKADSFGKYTPEDLEAQASELQQQIVDRGLGQYIGVQQAPIGRRQNIPPVGNTTTSTATIEQIMQRATQLQASGMSPQQAMEQAKQELQGQSATDDPVQQALEKVMKKRGL